jgi:hypothetical protein
MNKDRRKVIANIFADAAKYTLTAGAIGGILAGKMPLASGILLAMVFVVFILLAYFLTPKDKEE